MKQITMGFLPRRIKHNFIDATLYDGLGGNDYVLCEFCGMEKWTSLPCITVSESKGINKRLKAI